MTIQEAATKWRVKEPTIRKYIKKGYILGVEQNQLPDIPKPYTKAKPKKSSAIDNVIIKTLNLNLYISYAILDLSKDRFEERLKALEQNGSIIKKDKKSEDYTTNLNFALSAKAIKQFNLTININTQVKIAPQFGLVNTQIG